MVSARKPQRLHSVSQLHGFGVLIRFQQHQNMGRAVSSHEGVKSRIILQVVCSAVKRLWTWCERNNNIREKMGAATNLQNFVLSPPPHQWKRQLLLFSCACRNFQARRRNYLFLWTTPDNSRSWKYQVVHNSWPLTTQRHDRRGRWLESIILEYEQCSVLTCGWSCSRHGIALLVLDHWGMRWAYISFPGYFTSLQWQKYNAGL